MLEYLEDLQGGWILREIPPYLLRPWTAGNLDQGSVTWRRGYGEMEGQEIWGIITCNKGFSTDQFCDSSKIPICISVFYFVKEDNKSNQPEGVVLRIRCVWSSAWPH